MVIATIVQFGCSGDDSPSVIADTENPVAPLNLIASNITGTSALLSWDASTDNVAVTSYQLYQDGTLVETNLTATSFSPSNLTEASGYSFLHNTRRTTHFSAHLIVNGCV